MAASGRPADLAEASGPGPQRPPRIFVSVGSMLPFDRLVEAMDIWARDNPTHEVLIQIGNGRYIPRFAQQTRMMPPSAYRAEVAAADIFVAHAGMGSIFAALDASRPLLMLPRLRALGEHNTDHQLATMKNFGDLPGLHCAADVDDMYRRLSLLLADPGKPPQPVNPYASADFTNRIRAELTAGMPKKPPRILAIASGGGHWVQLLRLRPAWAGLEVAYATVYRHSKSDIPGERLFTFTDASRSNPLQFAAVVWELTRTLLTYRPTNIVTTGSAPALMAIAIGRLLGVRTLWIDSIANSEEMSTSGQMASRIAHVCYTQWPDLARPEGPHYMGRVL